MSGQPDRPLHDGTDCIVIEFAFPDGRWCAKMKLKRERLQVYGTFRVHTFSETFKADLQTYRHPLAPHKESKILP